MRLTVHLPRSLLNVRLHVAVNLARASRRFTKPRTTNDGQWPLRSRPQSRDTDRAMRRTQPIEAGGAGCWPREIKSLTQNLIGGLQRTGHQRATTQNCIEGPEAGNGFGPYWLPRQPKLNGRLADYGSANPLTCLVARAGIEPATFRFSGGRVSRQRLYTLVRLDVSCKGGRVGSSDSTRWPHFGPHETSEPVM